MGVRSGMHVASVDVYGGREGRPLGGFEVAALPGMPLECLYVLRGRIERPLGDFEVVALPGVPLG